MFVQYVTIWGENVISIVFFVLFTFTTKRNYKNNNKIWADLKDNTVQENVFLSTTKDENNKKVSLTIKIKILPYKRNAPSKTER